MAKERESRRYTRQGWFDRGLALFGSDQFKWKFKCPVCGHVQTPEDFRQYKNMGATPMTACQECIGRFAGGKTEFATKGDGVGCDYAVYGLIRLGDFVVSVDPETTVTTVDDIAVFPFAELEEGS